MKKKDSFKFYYNKDLDFPRGFMAAGIHAGIKKQGPDAAILFSDTPFCASGAFSQNLFRSLSVDLCIKNIQNPIRALLVFSGNANACTGKGGEETIAAVAAETAKLLSCKEQNILQSYTGVIGKPFPAAKVAGQLEKLINTARDKSSAFPFARSIMTTDLAEKKIACEIMTAEGAVRIAGVAKGSGMIYPQMATMLAYITTDALLDKQYQDSLIKRVTGSTFNRISVDGDSSTNDSFMLFSSREQDAIRINTPEKKKIFEAAVQQIALDLAKAMVRDGEGATKLITIHVKSAASEQAAGAICRSIANSLLVKTAIYGADPNWGRIIAAVGNAGVKLSPLKTELFIGPFLIFKNMGYIDTHSKQIRKLFRKKELEITVDLHSGAHSATFWTCDISHEYVTINAEYTT
ncbi:bifunctional glutamate N-acetyltransferase/amino-acid acetyltransferase ArgJ [Spirochaetota bacterium]